MGFLAPLGAALGSSLLGGVLGKIGTGPTNAERGVLGNDAAAQSTSLSAGQNLMGMGQGAVQQPLNYWSSILSGNKGLMTSALAPEINQIGQGYAQAAKTSGNLNPRGGPSVAFNSSLPWQQQRDVSTLFQTARPAAAQALGGLGSNLLSTGANSIYASTAAGRDILSQQMQMQKMQQENAQGIGKGLFSIFNGGGGQGGGGITDPQNQGIIQQIIGLFHGKPPGTYSTNVPGSPDFG